MIFDHYVCSGPCLLLLAIFQSAIIGWVYGELDRRLHSGFLLYLHNLVLRLLYLPSPIGSDRFCGNIADMIGYRPHVLIKYSWMYITPLTCIVSDFPFFSPNWVKCICTDVGHCICCGFNRALWYFCAWDTPPWSSTTPTCTLGGGMG